MIRPALVSDLDAIEEMIGKVVADMHAEDNDQWNDTYPVREDFQEDIAADQLYLNCADAQPDIIRGVVCFNHEESEEYKQVRWSENREAVVIHRLAVHPSFRGLGVAKSFFLFAETLAHAEGLDYLRSDTYALNPKMNRLFVQMGYRKTGDIHYNFRKTPFFCYDKLLDWAEKR